MAVAVAFTLDRTAILHAQATSASAPAQQESPAVSFGHTVLEVDTATAREPTSVIAEPPTYPTGAGAGLVINATFDANLDAASRTVIANAINFYQNTISTNITVNIYFYNMNAGLGSSFFVFYTAGYTGFRTALGSHATSADDAVALANTPTGAVNPINGSANLGVKSANGRAIGLNTPEVLFNFAGSPCPTFTGSGCIGLNVTLANSHGDLTAVVEHEIDEILGLGSALSGTTTTANPWPEDLFRWSSPGVRSYGANSSTTVPCSVATPRAFFSIDGGTNNLNEFNNCANGGDYGDWITHTPSQVQDAFTNFTGTPSLTATSTEVRALDVIGYDIVPPPAIVSHDFIGDFNGDGKADIPWRQNSGAVYAWLMNGTSVIGQGSPGGAPSDWSIAGVGDFNGDGKADLLWRHTSGGVYLWLMDGTSMIGGGSLGTVGTDWAIVGIGDFNGDGKADILWRQNSGTVYEWLLDGTSLIGQGSPGGVATDWTISRVGDFNGDGRADILWRHSTGTVYEWLLNGTSVIGQGSLGGVTLDWQIVGVGDFNADGKTDILWRQDSGTVYEWLLNGTSVIGQGSPGGASTDWAIAGVGDFNGDGRADILWRHSSGTVYEWFLNGTSLTGQGSPGTVGNDWFIQ